MYQPKHVQTRTRRQPSGQRGSPYSLTDEELQARRTGRAEARRLRKRARQRRRLQRLLPLLLVVVLLAAGIGSVALVRSLLHSLFPHNTAPEDDPPFTEPLTGPDADLSEPVMEPILPVKPKTVFRPTPDIVRIAEDDASIYSGFLILIDLDEGTILAEKNAWTTVHPASMTKILTLLVAVEHLTDLTGSAVVTQTTTDFCTANNCSIAGFLPEEEVSILDLLYGTILPSGADAALTLAEYTAGSQEAFVRMMNEKAEELGISRTAQFANCVGLYDEKNVCTPYDMAIILKAAMENDTCRKILGERIHDLPPSELHPEGLSLSNWFIRRIEDHMPAGTAVKGAKTGFITEAGSCAASLAQDASGHTYICVTAMAGSAWQCIFDHVTLYSTYGFSTRP